MDVASPLDVRTADVQPVTKSSWVKSLLREPLLHFLLLGGLIFIGDWAARSDTNSAHVIVVDDKVRNELIGLFQQGQGRQPTSNEIKALIDRWIYNEVMYREATALGLDKGDEMFRSRLELKMRALLIDNVVVDPPTDDDLRQWLESHRDRHTAPQRFDFVQIRIDGSDAQAKAVDLASQLSAEKSPTIPPDSEYDDNVRYYRDRSRDNIAAVFGEPFATGLLDAGGKWVAVQSTTGWHVARMISDKPPVDPDFEAIRPQLTADWQKFQQNRLAAEAFRAIRDRYDIRIEKAP